jgi:hypothetical protein
VTAAEIISRNVRRLRRARGWTQTEAAHRFSEITGQPQSNASWSAGEQVGKSRQRQWSANDIASLAVLFDVPVGDLFEPQPPCRSCGGEPPSGFTCNACGAGGGA